MLSAHQKNAACLWMLNRTNDLFIQTNNSTRNKRQTLHTKYAWNLMTHFQHFHYSGECWHSIEKIAYNFNEHLTPTTISNGQRAHAQ